MLPPATAWDMDLPPAALAGGTAAWREYRPFMVWVCVSARPARRRSHLASMGVATGGASRGRAPPLCLSGGAGPPNFFSGSDNHSDSQRARDPRMGLSKAGMSLNISWPTYYRG